VSRRQKEIWDATDFVQTQACWANNCSRSTRRWGNSRRALRRGCSSATRPAARTWCTGAGSGRLSISARRPRMDFGPYASGNSADPCECFPSTSVDPALFLTGTGSFQRGFTRHRSPGACGCAG
jgi:hypothetical protein